MKKRVLAMLLCVAMIASVFTGCTSKEEANDSAVVEDDASAADDEVGEEAKSSIWLADEDSPTLSMLIQVGSSDKDPNDMWFFKYYEEMTGVDTDVTGVLSENWADQKQVMMASGEYPGVIWKGGWTTEEMTEYSEDGTFLDLTDYLQYMPNYVAAMDKIEGSWDNVTAPDGGIYSVSSVRLCDFENDYPFWINKTWLENLGLEKPETVEEFYNVLKAFKEQDADGDGNPTNEIPYSAYYGMEDNNIRTSMLNSFGFNTDGETDFNVAIQSWNDEACYMPLTDRYKDYLTFMNKLMEEGLLDQDLFSQDVVQYEAKLNEGNVGVFNSWLSTLTDVSVYENYDFLVLKYDETSEKIALYTDPVEFGTAVITDNCEDPVLAAKWIDMFYIPEHAHNIQNGPMIWQYPDGTTEIKSEGVTEDPGVSAPLSLDENGNFISQDFTNADPDLGPWFWLCLEHPVIGMFNSTLDEIYYYSQLVGGMYGDVEADYEWNWNRYLNENESPENRSLGYAKAVNSKETYEYRAFGYPNVFPTAEQQEWIDENRVILDDYVIEMEAKFITGTADIETEYDAYMAELINKGAEEYQQIYIDLYK